jgi:hypothetical protein
MRRASWWVGVSMIAIVGLVGSRPGAADADKRRQLRDEIERLLNDMASELRDVPTDSSTSDLDRTIDYAGRVHDKARELRDHIDGDSDASRMASNYPDIAKRYQEYARYLRELKNGHRRIDEWPKKCETATRELAEQLRRYTDSHDPRGIEELPRLARDKGRTGKEAIEAAERTRNEMYTWYDRVDDFSDSDGKWSDVRTNLIAAGRTMHEYTTRQSEQIKRDDTCGNLAKEERNPLVEQSMAKLFDGKKGIETLYEALDRQLGEMASALDGLAGDSDDSDVTAAERKLDEIDRLLEQLDRVKGNDGEAKRRVEAWRNISRAGRAAMAQLHTLKQSQFRVDKAPARCKETDDKLAQLIRDFLGRRDPRGITEIALRARGFAEPLKDALAKADEAHQAMERALSEAQRFDPSEGRWRAVTEKSRGSATAIFEYWKKAREAAHASCDELAKGDENRDVKRAIADLSRSRSDNQTELDRIKNDHQKWYDGVKELREWYKQDTENVRQGFCTLAESPGDFYEGDAYLETLDRIADRMASRIQPRWNELTRESTKLIERLKKLEAEQDSDVKAGATKLREAIERTERGMFGILSDELKGRNDVEVRTFIEVGKNEHKRIQADSSKCEVSEITVPGESMRLDCVRVSSGTCFIVEIKPNNSAAQSRGRSRLDEYLAAVRKRFESSKDRIDSAFTDKMAIFKRCVADGRISLEAELRVYDFCPPDGKLFRDFVVQ